MPRIESKSNEKIKHICSLMTSPKARRESGEFMLEGARLCFDGVQSGVEVLCAFFTGDAKEKYPGCVSLLEEKAAQCFEISPEVCRKISDTESSQGVFCQCKMPEREFSPSLLESGGVYLALENLSDPSNLGAVCRTAEALGITGLIVCSGCDVYNPKALRSAMGSSLRLNIIICPDAAQVFPVAKAKGITTYGSTPREGAKDIRILEKKQGIIIFVGNEGNGLTDETLSACDELVTIPMKGRAESLNAAAAAAVLVWEAVR